MKANEFVKKFGWEHSKYIAEKWYNPHKSFDTKTYHTTYYRDNSGETSLVELKRLIESHELIIKDFESIEIAKYEYMVSGSYSDPYWIQVKQAIADVESCQ